mmetsp:Transcript_15535/g.30982  ORF Transcript_15535/g.30982 Transcript_15535/m.30982 type:complete len:109 (+) Transcript_15535:646-972(+)
MKVKERRLNHKKLRRSDIGKICLGIPNLSLVAVVPFDFSLTFSSPITIDLVSTSTGSSVPVLVSPSSLMPNLFGSEFLSAFTAFSNLNKMNNLLKFQMVLNGYLKGGD